MKKIGLLGLLVAGTGLVLFAQDEAAYTQAMKTAAGQMGALRKMEKKTGADAAAAADKVAAAYAQMSEFWMAKHADDAVKLADAGKASAEALSAAAKADDTEKADASFKAIGATCGGCHSAHREKNADGTYKIK